jgi:hypothetical protein
VERSFLADARDENQILNHRDGERIISNEFDSFLSSSSVVQISLSTVFQPRIYLNHRDGERNNAM